MCKKLFNTKKRKMIIIILSIIIFILLFISWFCFVGTPPRAERVEWGVNFSHTYAQGLGLD